MKKTIIMFVCLFALSTVGVFANTYYACRNRAATGYGWTQSYCSDKTLASSGKFESNNGSYTTWIYIGNSNDPEVKFDRMNAKSRVAYISWLIGIPYQTFSHLHSYMNR